MVVFGYILVLLGTALVTLGVTGAALKVFANQAQNFSGAEPGLADLLDLLPKIIDSLSKAPSWIAMVVVGLIVLIIGARLAGNRAITL